MGTCRISGCRNPIWGGGVCKYHNYTRRMKGGDLYQKKTKEKKQKPIAKKSKKLQGKEPYYMDIKNEIREELIEKGQYKCIFCNEDMGDERQFHHLKGRVGKDLTERKYLQPAHGVCHVEIYHRLPVEKLRLLSWYPGFLERLRGIDERLWEKETGKEVKSRRVNKLNPAPIEDEDDLLF